MGESSAGEFQQCSQSRNVLIMSELESTVGKNGQEFGVLIP